MGAKHTEYMTIRVPAQLRRGLKAFARGKRWSESEAARYLVERGLTKGE